MMLVYTTFVTAMRQIRHVIPSEVKNLGRGHSFLSAGFAPPPQILPRPPDYVGIGTPQNDRLTGLV